MATKSNRNRYKIAEVKAQMRDAVGGDTVDVETDDGSVFHLPHPLFYDRAMKAALKALDDEDSDGIARALLGDDQFDKYVDAGGDPDDLNFVMMAVQKDATDSLAGRARPTRS